MGHSAKLELFRRLVPLFLAVLGIVGALTFLSPLSGLLCVIAGIGIYCAMPKQKVPTGAVRPAVQPGVLVTDAIGYVIGVPLFCLSLLGAAYGTGSATSLLFLTLLIPASFSILIFMTAIRQETSWIRFFGNGFEVTQLGLKARVRYTDLSSMRVRQVRLSRGLGWFFATLGSGTRRRIALLGDAEDSKTLIFVSKGGTEFAVSSEMIPDLQRVLIGMDRAGVELPEGISERERKKIRRVRERMYRKPDVPNMEQLDVARIAATVRKYQQRNA